MTNSRIMSTLGQLLYYYQNILEVYFKYRIKDEQEIFRKFLAHHAVFLSMLSTPYKSSTVVSPLFFPIT